MESWEERIARYRAEIKAKEEQLDREEAIRRAEAEADRQESAVVQRRSGKFRDVVIIGAALLMSAALIGLGVTLSRLAGRDFEDAKRTGLASVTACVRHGPVSTRGFGYWEGCDATVTWGDGGSEYVSAAGVFTSADIGTPVRVGDMGRHRAETVLSRADVPERPWLRWLGFPLAIIGSIPLLFLGLMLGALLSGRRR